ncbi:hypothetical protein BC938DRAFT_472932 [Jimgerdemannia flammicorona]|uniref:Uncharacterized protein n=1 Tax=Jimgerdemannia flammicorona TaxID=994334 RepID=A0A433Q544_9FUNG|nr:hypothetical protein BC938DRAFT_472932 [Jimgerdemannia flammicorona]
MILNTTSRGRTKRRSTMMWIPMTPFCRGRRQCTRIWRQENVTYPADNSSPDIWRLPSGLSVTEAIRPPSSLLKARMLRRIC